MGIAIDLSWLVGGVLQAALWGFYSLVFCIYLYSARLSKSRTIGSRRRYAWSDIAAYLMYIIATAHFSLVLRRMVEGFIIYPNANPPIPPSLYYYEYSGIRERLNGAKEIFYTLESIISDSVLVWRCTILWQGKYIWVTVLPICLVILTALGGIVGTALQIASSTNIHADDVLGSMLFFASFLTNVVATSLLAVRLVQLTHNCARRRSETQLSEANQGPGSRGFTLTLRTVFRLIVESGVIISAIKLTEFVLFETTPDTNDLNGQNGLYVVFDCVPQIVGAVPTAILILVNLGYTTDVRSTVESHTLEPLEFKPNVVRTHGTSASRAQASSLSSVLPTSASDVTRDVDPVKTV